MPATLPSALYEPDGDVLVPTVLTRGPWSPDAQHAGPPSALLARAIEAAAGIADGQLVRIALDVLRPVPLQPLTVIARHVRPGRNVEQLVAELALAADGTVLMRAHAWRMRRARLDLPGGLGTPDAPPPHPDGLEVAGLPPFFVTGEESYVSCLEWRFFGGDWLGAGPAAVWTRMRAQLVAGEDPTPLEHLLTMTDAASGVSATLPWETFTFMNVDLSLALERPPAGEWLAMDAITRPGALGAGVCTAVLSDLDGRVGSSSAALLIAPR
jgi:hypothetical protein